MTCKELQHLLYSARTDELSTVEREFLIKHLNECDACTAVFRKVSEADRILGRLKDATPRIRNEHTLTESIIASIVSGKKSAANDRTKTFLDQLNELFSMEITRFACGIVIFLLGMMYVIMEYNDTKAIVGLEERLGTKSELNRSDIFQQEINALSVLHDLYNLSTGSASSVQLTNTLVLIKKADLQLLLKGYKTLDEASRTRLNKIWDKYSREESSIIGSEKNREEIIALRSEIERLKKELERINHEKGRQ